MSNSPTPPPRTACKACKGDTVACAHLVVGEHTGAASAYVGITRGRAGNIAYLVAENIDDAREQWIGVFASLRRTQQAELAAAGDHYRQARARHVQAAHHRDDSDAVIAVETTRVRDDLLSAWGRDRPAAGQAARVVAHGGGPLGLRLGAVNRAREELARWSVRWQPYLPDMPTRNDHIVRTPTAATTAEPQKHNWSGGGWEQPYAELRERKRMR